MTHWWNGGIPLIPHPTHPVVPVETTCPLRGTNPPSPRRKPARLNHPKVEAGGVVTETPPVLQWTESTMQRV